MTVDELIAALQALPEEQRALPVCFEDTDWDDCEVHCFAHVRAGDDYAGPARVENDCVLLCSYDNDASRSHLPRGQREP